MSAIAANSKYIRHTDISAIVASQSVKSIDKMLLKIRLLVCKILYMYSFTRLVPMCCYLCDAIPRIKIKQA